MGIHIHTHDHSGGHSDGHSHSPHPSGEIPRSLSMAVVVTATFMVVEAIGGYLANSLALLSDAAHMLMDVGAILLSLFAYWVSRRPSTPTMSYGYHRAEILGALISGLLIWLIAGVLAYEAIIRLQSPPEVKGPIVFVVALIGLIANLAAMKFLHKTQKQSINVKAAYYHVIADSLGSVGALIAGGVIWWTGWYPIDPILTLVLSVMMLWGSWGLVKESISVLMESAPSHLDPAEVQASLEGVTGVDQVHDLHIWSVSSGRPALSVHLISAEGQIVLNSANQLLQERYGITHTTIQVEDPKDFNFDRCYDCKPG